MERPGQKTIEGMSHADLSKFINNMLTTQPPNKGASYDQVDVHGVLNVKDKLNLSPQAKANLLSDYVTLAALATDLSSYVQTVNDAGREIGYDQITATVNITGTTSGTATTIIAAAAHTFDGTPVLLEFSCPQIITPSVAGNSVGIGLYEGGSLVSLLATVLTPAAANMRAPVCARQRFTPSAGSHTYTIAAFVTSTTGTPQAVAGTGIGAGQAPTFLRFTKV